MKLPPPGEEYNAQQERTRNLLLEQEDNRNQKRGRDIEVGEASVILQSPDGTRHRLLVANDGTLSTEAL